MNRVIMLFSLVLFAVGCSDETKVRTADNERLARLTIANYLVRNKLPDDDLAIVGTGKKPIADFVFLYQGGGRCIEFLVNCHGSQCSDLQKYPYDEHGDKCPKH